MTHALTAFINERAAQRSLSRDKLIADSGLSKQVVSKWVTDTRPRLTRLPDRATLEGFAKALRVPFGTLAGKAVEALDVGYTAGDFISTIDNASNEEVLEVLADRLGVRTLSDPPGTDVHLKAVAKGGGLEESGENST